MSRARGAPLVLVAAGGTGGHLFPAEALAAALARRNIPVALATDSRAAKFCCLSARARACHSERDLPRPRSVLSVMRTGSALAYGLTKAFFLYGRLKPSIVVGFGGYPTVPPVMAASLRGIPTLIHEQNGVMGRANKFLAGRVTAIATGFAGVTDHDAKLAAKTTCTGNPVRPTVVAAASTPIDTLGPNDPFRLLVFGGSQGARVMADIVPDAVARLEPHLLMRLKIVQQAREEDMPRVREAYARAQVQAFVSPFFSDLPVRMAAAPPRYLPLRRLDRRRACGHRPALDPRAAAACARSGPGRQCRGAGKGGRGDPAAAGRVHARPPGRRNRRACGRSGADHRHGGRRKIGRRA